MNLRPLLLLPVVAVLVACGGKASSSSSSMLHLKNEDINEAAFRSGVKVELRRNLLATTMACGTFKGLSLDEAVKVTRNASASSTPDAYPGSVARPGQAEDPASFRRGVAILLEECAPFSK